MLIAAGESLDRKKVDTAEDNFKESENNESGDPKHHDDQEMKESMGKSEANVETYPPFFKESVQGSSKHEECKSSSIIPEPLSSPSLASHEQCKSLSIIPEPPSSPSLPSLEEDENTPSLGLEDDDWVSYHSLNTLNNKLFLDKAFDSHSASSLLNYQQLRQGV